MSTHKRTPIPKEEPFVAEAQPLVELREDVPTETIV